VQPAAAANQHADRDRESVSNSHPHINANRVSVAHPDCYANSYPHINSDSNPDWNPNRDAECECDGDSYANPNRDGNAGYPHALSAIDPAPLTTCGPHDGWHSKAGSKMTKLSPILRVYSHNYHHDHDIMR